MDICRAAAVRLSGPSSPFYEGANFADALASARQFATFRRVPVVIEFLCDGVRTAAWLVDETGRASVIEEWAAPSSLPYTPYIPDPA